MLIVLHFFEQTNRILYTTVGRLLASCLMLILIAGCKMNSIANSTTNRIEAELTSVKLQNVKTINIYDPIFLGRKIVLIKITCETVTPEGNYFENKTIDNCLSGESYFGRDEEGKKIIRNYILKDVGSSNMVGVFLDHEHGSENYIINKNTFVTIQLNSKHCSP